MRGAYHQRRRMASRSLQPRPPGKGEQSTIERRPSSVSSALAQMTIPPRGGLLANTRPALQAPLSWRAGAVTSPSQQLLSFRRRVEIARQAMSEHGAEESVRETRRREDDENLLFQNSSDESDSEWRSRREYTSSLGPPALASQDQANQRAMNTASGEGQESIGSRITDSETVPNSKVNPTLAPPRMPPRISPQNMNVLGGEPLMRPPSSRVPPLTPRQTKRELKRQQKISAHISSENARIHPINELHDRSRGIMNERTARSGHGRFRGELKYTISEDRTTDTFKRRKLHLTALGQYNSRAAEVEEVDKSDAARVSVLVDSYPRDDMGTMATDDLEDLFNMDEYENPEQSTFDDALFNFE